MQGICGICGGRKGRVAEKGKKRIGQHKRNSVGKACEQNEHEQKNRNILEECFCHVVPLKKEKYSRFGGKSKAIKKC